MLAQFYPELAAEHATAVAFHKEYKDAVFVLRDERLAVVRFRGERSVEMLRGWDDWPAFVAKPRQAPTGELPAAIT